MIDILEKLRPDSIDNMLVTSKIVKLIKSNKSYTDKMSHAMVFHGPPGTGKTTLSRIISSIRNPLKDQNYIEIDGTKTGIDGMKEIQELASQRRQDPFFSEDLIICIDEAENLASKEAISCILKIAEPSDADMEAIKKREHDPVYLILCCNDISPLQKIKDGALIGRMTVYNFAIPSNDLLVETVDNWAKILNAKSFKAGASTHVVEYFTEFESVTKEGVRGLIKTFQLYLTDPDTVIKKIPPEGDAYATGTTRTLLQSIICKKWKAIAKSLDKAIKSNTADKVRTELGQFSYKASFDLAEGLDLVDIENTTETMNSFKRIIYPLMYEMIPYLNSPHNVDLMARIRRVYEARLIKPEN